MILCIVSILNIKGMEKCVFPNHVSRSAFSSRFLTACFLKYIINISIPVRIPSKSFKRINSFSPT